MTQREAAQLLGVHVSAVPKMVRRGDLVPRSAKPSLSRAAVLALRDARAAAADRRTADLNPRGPRPPDAKQTWLRAAGAAAVLDSTPVSVMARARRSRLPSTLHDGARWFALEQLELIERADRAQRSRRLAGA